MAQRGRQRRRHLSREWDREGMRLYPPIAHTMRHWWAGISTLRGYWEGVEVFSWLAHCDGRDKWVFGHRGALCVLCVCWSDGTSQRTRSDEVVVGVSEIRLNESWWPRCGFEVKMNGMCGCVELVFVFEEVVGDGGEDEMAEWIFRVYFGEWEWVIRSRWLHLWPVWVDKRSGKVVPIYI